MGMAWPQGGGDVQRRAANGVRRRHRPTGGRAPRGTGQDTHERHAREPRRGRRIAGRRRARTARYGGGQTGRADDVARGCVPGRIHIRFSTV
jgi:hypothetical protein